MNRQQSSPVRPIGTVDKPDKTKAGGKALACAAFHSLQGRFVRQVHKGLNGLNGLNGRKAAMCKRL